MQALHPLALERVTTVLLDLDGTLIDHDGAVSAALHAWLPSYGLSHDKITAATPLWLDLRHRHYQAWQSRQVTFREQRRRTVNEFASAIGMPVRLDQLDALFAEYLAYFEAAWTAFEDAAPALRRIASARLQVAVLTNGDHAQQTAKLKVTGLYDLCGPVFTSSELPAPKPDPRSYLTVCRLLQVTPCRALMVGDDYELDVAAARAAGLQAIHLDRSPAGTAVTADSIRSLDELLANQQNL